MGIAQYDVNKVNAMGTERKKYFEGIGVDVQTAHSLETAINVSGLNFEVAKQPLAFMTQVPQQLGSQTILVDVPHPFPNQFATVRTDTLEPLGVVGKDYQILQNIEAFDFLDSLVGDAKFETAGLYGNGAKSFITMSTEPMKILDDEFAPYILFTNSFDGSGAVKVMFTPIRVFCSNALVRAIKNATNKLSIRHSSNLQSRLDNARYVLLNNTNYLNALKAESEKLAVTPFSAEAFSLLVL
jgi:phage/plasmid-like protein (TIGR03299 family)